MRTLWTGSLSFGLVNIPIKLYSGTQENRPNLDMLHKADLSPIRYAKVCRHDGKEVAYGEIVKGYEYHDGDYIILTDEDFEKANVKKTKTIEILAFANLDEVDTIYYEKPYYLEPDKGAAKAYALLREALKKSGRVGVTKFVLRNREHLGIIKPEGSLLVLDQMRFADEIREPAGLKIPTDQDVSGKEIDMALALIDQLTQPFEIEAYKDTYTDELQRIIEAKAAGKVPVAKGETPKPAAEVKDLISLLQASLEKEKAGEPRKERKRRTSSRKRAS